MALAWSSEQHTSDSPGDGSVIFQLVVSGSNRYVLVGISAWDGLTTLTVNTPTFDGAAMNLVASYQDSGSQAIIAWYDKIAPATGTIDIAASTNHTSSVYMTCGATSYTGVDQSIAHSAVAFNRGWGLTASVAVPSVVSGELVVDLVSMQEGPTVDASQTQRWNTGGQPGASSEKTGTGSVVMQWTDTLLGEWNQMAMRLYPVGGAPAPTRLVQVL